jgi:hypothetical protein
MRLDTPSKGATCSDTQISTPCLWIETVKARTAGNMIEGNRRPGEVAL